MTSGQAVLNDKVYTIEDYMKLDDGNRYELIDGELIIMEPHGRYSHQKVSGRFFNQIENFLQENPVGEVVYEMDVHLGERVVGPDVLFVSNERIDIIGELYLTAAPDLVIEVLSPSTALHDKKTKRKIYYENGVKEYWIVDPDNDLVEVLAAGEEEWRWGGVYGSGDVLTTALLPGLEIKLKDVFRKVAGRS